MNRLIVLPVVVLTIGVLALVATACGGGDPYSGTWLTPNTAASEPQYSQIRISPANEGWWSVEMGQGPLYEPMYVAKIGHELQSGNGAVRLEVDGDTLTIVAPTGYPAFTRK